MEPEDLVELIQKIQKLQCEQQAIEVKAAHKGCPTRLYDSLSSFSNQDMGGIIVFGLDEKKGFEAVGVYNPQDLMHRVGEQCKQMSPIVRPLFTLCEYHNKVIVSAEIPAVDISERPVFYKGIGRIKGSYIRMGEADEPMSDYEIYSYEAYRRRICDDRQLVQQSGSLQLDDSKLSRYLLMVKESKPNLAGLEDRDILELMGILSDGQPSLAGVMCFHKYPQALFPQLCITAVVVPGTEMGQTGTDGERFLANRRIEGTIDQMLEETMIFVRRNLNVKTIVNDEGKREDKYEYPLPAIREAVINSLMHRDYSIHTQGTPIRLVIYNNRIEIINEGGLYGKLTVDSLGRVHGDTRNQTLTAILEVLQIAENRYSGIPTIRMQMKAFKLPVPVFENRRGTFVVTLYNNRPGNVTFKEENQAYTLPVANHLWGGWSDQPMSPCMNPFINYRENPEWANNPCASKQLGSDLCLREEVTLYGTAEGGQSVAGHSKEHIRQSLISFCIQPKSRQEIAEFLDLTQYYALKHFVIPLVAEGRLQLTIKDKPKSKNQKYIAT